jgi:hypothetical protein
MEPLCVIVLICCTACGFVDLRPIGVTVVPGESGALLPEMYSPVAAVFDTEMDTRSSEAILQISSGAGSVAGDRFWNGNTLYFVPAAGWTAGTRYTLGLSGTVTSADGRELRLDRYVFFYAINTSAPPLLEWFSPADGESVRTGGLVMELRFSCPMDRTSVETSVNVDGMGDKQFEWSDDDRTLRIIPAKECAAWMVYHWALKDGARSRDGVPLAKAVSACFSTDLDKLPPRVERVFPALYSAGKWLPTGGGIAGDLGPGQGIAVEFNKPMSESALRSIRFDPTLAGRTEQLSPNRFVFIPSRDPEPETAYTLTIPADSKDAEGLKLGADYRLSFTADIPYLRILSFHADGVSPLQPDGSNTNGAAGDLGGGSAFAVPVNTAADGLLCFTIHFSLPVTTIEAKQTAALKITLAPFFPVTLAPVALRSVTWLSEDRLRMEWERLEPGTANEDHYYRLLIPGGRGGIDTGDGMRFREDQYLYLEAVN